MLFVITACIAVYVVWLSTSEPLTTTTGISWKWLDAPLADVGLLEANTTSAELSDTLFQAVAIPADTGVLHQVMDVATVLKADSSQNEPGDMKAHADDTPPQSIIWQLPKPTVAVVEATVAATASVDDAVTLVSVHPQSTQFPASVARVHSRLWSSSLSSSITPVSLFTIAIAVLVGFAMGFVAHSVSLSTGWDNLPTLFVEVCGPPETVTSCVIDSVVSSTVEAGSGGQIRQGEVVVVQDIPVLEKTEHSENPKATDNTASIPSGNVSSSDAVQPLRTSISEVQSTDDRFTPGESRASLYATAAEGNTPSQTTDGSDVFSVPTVSSEHNIYMLAATMSFPSLDDLAKVTEFERLREDVRGFGDEPKAEGSTAPTLPATELGVSPSTAPSAPVSPRSVQVKPLESFRDRWGQDTKHLWAREFWHRALRSEELIKIVYQAVFPPDEAVTDKDKYEMELGEGLIRISALRLSEHATNPILRLPYNVLPEDADPKDSLFVETEATETVVSSSASTGGRAPSPFERPSNPQSRLFESSSSEASVAAPTHLPSPSRTPAARRTRPALAQVTNTPRSVHATPSRTWIPMNAVRVRGAHIGVPTPPPSVRPKLAKHASRFPPVASSTRRQDERDSPTRPARRGPPSSSKFPRWRG